MQDSLTTRSLPQTSTDRCVPRPHRAAPSAFMLGVLTLLGAAGCDGGSLPIESEAPAAPNVVALAEAAPNSWQARAPMPTGRYGLVAASVNGIVYAIGGWFNGTLRTVEAYHPTTNTLVAWRTMAKLPAARTWPSGAAVISGKIYVTGGIEPNERLCRQRGLHVVAPGDVKTATCSEVAVRLIVGMSWSSPPSNQRCGFLKSPLIFCLASSLASAFFS
jgi:hypothetical protein